MRSPKREHLLLACFVMIFALALLPSVYAARSVVDNSLSANTTSVFEGHNITVAGSYTVTGNAGGAQGPWTVALNDTNNGITINGSCSPGKDFRVIGFTCGYACTNSTALGWVQINNVNANYLINWTLQVCTNATTYSPARFQTYKFGGGTGAATFNNPTANISISKDIPNVTLAAPANGSLSSSSTNFTCNATTPLSALANVTLYWNVSGSLIANGSVNISGLSNQTTFQRTGIISGNILWNCYACNSLNQCAFASANQTVTINNPPTQSNPILNSSLGQNTSLENYTIYNQSTTDIESNPVKNIIACEVDGAPFSVLNMPFEGGSNASFTKGYSHDQLNGAVYNATWNATGGYDGKGAYMFNGNSSYIDTNNDPNLNLTGEVAILAWVKLSSLGSDQKIVGKQNGSSGGYKLGVYTDNRLEMEIRDAANTPTLNRAVAGGTNLTTNQWYCVAGVYSQSRGYIRTYINGVLDRELNTSSVLATTSSTLNIGREPFAQTAYWNGTIDDISVFGRFIPVEAIRAFCNNQTYLLVSQVMAPNETWACMVTPNDGYQDGATLYTNNVTIRAVTAPTSALASPQNASYSTANQSFTCNATTATYPVTSLRNITFYWNYSGSFVANGTSNISGPANSTTFARTAMSDRSLVWNCYACDNLGNCSFAATNNTLTVDTLFPTISFASTTDVSGGSFSRGYVQANATAADLNLANITVRLYNSSGSLLFANTSAASPFFINYTGLADGLYYFNATAVDLAGNTNRSETRNVTLDRIAPSLSIASPSGGTNYSTTTILVNLTSNGAANIWFFNGTANQTYTVPVNVTFPEGLRTLTAYANDTAGNLNTTNVTFRVDTTKPDILFVSPTDANGTYVNRRFLLINVTASDGGSGLTNINTLVFNASGSSAGTRSTATSPQYTNFSLTADGRYHFNATATDGAGNTNSTLTWNVTVDTLNPSIQFVSPTDAPGAFYSRGDIRINITFADNNLANATVYLYNASGALLYENTFGLSPQYIDYTGLSDGLYYLNATARDLAGNSNSTFTRNVTLDTVAPSLSIASPLAGANYSTTTILVNLSVSGASDIWFFNGTANQSYSSPVFVSFSHGLHTLVAYANDSAGNINSTNVTFNVDVVGPSVAIIYPLGTESLLQKHDVTIAVNVSDPAGVDAVRANITLPNGSSVSLTGFSHGLMGDDFSADTVNVSWSHANLTGPGQVCYTDIDGTVPGKMFISLDGGSGPSMHCGFDSIKRIDGDYDLNISFNVTYMGDDTFFTLRSAETTSMLGIGVRVYLNLIQTTGGARYYRLAYSNGSATVQQDYPTTDLYGRFRIRRWNMTGTPAFNLYYWNHTSSSWANPLGDIVLPGSARTQFIQFKPGAQASNYGALNMTLDDFQISECLYLFSVFNQTNATGRYDFTIVANDTYGNVNGSVASFFNLSVWDDPPSRPYFEEPDPGDVVRGVFNISWGQVVDAENDALRFNITLLNADGSYNASVVSGYGNASSNYYSWDTTAVADGVYGLRIVVFEYNSPMNLSTTEVLAGNFTIDNTPPGVTFVAPSDVSGSYASKGNVVVNASAVDFGSGLANLTVSLFNASGSLLNVSAGNVSPVFLNFTGLGDGLYLFNATAYDLAGNRNATGTSNVTLDRVAPLISIVSPLAGANYSTTTILVNLSVSGASDVWFFNGTANQSYSSPVFVSFSHGLHTLVAYANDSAGNLNSTNMTFNVDVVGPEVVIIHPLGTERLQQKHDVAIVVNVSDPAGVDIVRANITLPNGSSVPLTGFSHGLMGDDFSADTVNVSWSRTNLTGLGQVCYTDIDGTVPGKMFISLDGGSGPSMHCGFDSVKRLDGDFDLNISFNVTHMGDDTFFTLRSAETTSLQGIGIRVYLNLIQVTGGARFYRFAYSNGTATTQQDFPTTDLYGRFRIRRANITGTPVFNLYYWNHSSGSWNDPLGDILLPGSARTQFIQIKPGAQASNYGALNMTLDDFQVSECIYQFAVFQQTNMTGVYNFTIIANDTYGNINATVSSIFNLSVWDDPPSRPFFEEPDPGDIVRGVFNISWGQVVDAQGDDVRFNITLLNADGSDNASLVSGYGNLSSVYYPWNTTLHPDGVYKLRIIVSEVNTAMNLSTTEVLAGNFTIDNTPPGVAFVAPSDVSGSYASRGNVVVNASAVDFGSGLANVTVYLFNASGSLLNVSSANVSPVFLNFTGLDDGLYLFNATGFDVVGNRNASETRNVTLDRIAPPISIVSPLEGANYSDASVLVNISTEGASEIWFFNGTDNQSYVTPVFVTFPEGLTTLVVWANDSAGNLNSNQVQFRVDTLAPDIAFSAPTEESGSAYSRTDIRINATAADSGSGLTSIQISLYNASGSLLASNSSGSSPFFIAYNGLSDGMYLFNATAYDHAQNSNSSESRNVTIDTTAPQSSDPAASTPTVYWNETITFNASWTDRALAAYIFSINQSGAWLNQSSVPFSGAANLSTASARITAAAGTSVGWHFFANDTAGNANQTATQAFTVQQRPTGLVISVNESMYPQGKSPGNGYDPFIPFEVRYIDVLSGQPVGGASCFVTNNATTEQVGLTFNSTTGNFTGEIPTYLLYGDVLFQANCSKTNHVAQVNTTSAAVRWLMYLQDWENTSYGPGLDYQTVWLLRQQPTGAITVLNETVNAQSGENENLHVFRYYASGINGSFQKSFSMLGLKTLRMNLSVNDSSCQPMLCHHVSDFYGNEVFVDCGPGQTIPANTPTLLTQALYTDFSIRQNDYYGIDVHLNCTTDASVLVQYYYNSSVAAANTEAENAQPSQVAYSLVALPQVDSGYVVGPNKGANMTRRWSILFNNTGSTSQYLGIYAILQIQSGLYPNSRIAQTNYVYNSTGDLWASDNASAGAPNNATIYPSNIIHWISEMIPANSSITQTLQAGVKNGVRNVESITLDTSSQKIWNADVYTIFIPEVFVHNVSAYSNYQAYGVPDTFAFSIQLTNLSGTHEITNQTIINATAKTLEFPLISVNADGVTFTVTASDVLPPQISFAPPTPAESSTQAEDWTIINVTVLDDGEADNCWLSWDGVNTTMARVGSGNTVSCWINKTGIASGDHTYAVYANDSAGNTNSTLQRNLARDTQPPQVFINSPAEGSLWNSHVLLVDISTTGNASSVWFFNGTANQTYTGPVNVTFPEGNTTLIAYANDSVGNVNQTSSTFEVDTIPPSFTVVSPAQWAIYGTASVLVDFSAASAASLWFFNSTSNQSFIAPVYAQFPPGNNTLTMYANDSAGNMNSTSISFYIDLASPSWSNPSINETPVYWNRTVLFTAAWDNTALEGFLFSTNQTGTWTNSSYSPFSGPSNSSSHAQAVTADAGTAVGWYFWANDSVGNSNQTDVQSFIVQPRPAYVILSTDKTHYARGKLPGSGYDQYMLFEASYADSLSGAPIPAASCTVTNGDSGEQANLTFNASTGNYTGALNNFYTYGNATMGVSCMAANHQAAANSTTVGVYDHFYLVEIGNNSWGIGPTEYTTHWSDKIPPTGEVFAVNVTLNATGGQNHVQKFPFNAAGPYRTLPTSVIFSGNVVGRLNISVSNDSCQPLLCLAVFDAYLYEVYEACGSPQTIPENTPTLVTYSGPATFSLQQGFYLVPEVYVNCTNPVDDLQVVVYTNYSGMEPTLEMPEIYPLIYSVVDRGQIETGYLLGPNNSINTTRYVSFVFNNTAVSEQAISFSFIPAIKSQYPGSIAPNNTYVYDQSGNLWASDNASAGANTTVHVDFDNQITWTTPVISGGESIFQNVTLLALNSIWDVETLLVDTAATKIWHINVSSIASSQVSVHNLTIFTNYSAYGAKPTYSFNISFTNATGMYDISDDVSANASTGILTFPTILSTSVGVSYLVTATDVQAPSIDIVVPTPDDGFTSNTPDLVFNITASDDNAIDTCILSWNGVNETMNKTGSPQNATCTAYKGGLAPGNHSFLFTVNDTASHSTATQPRTVRVNDIPQVTLIHPLGETFGDGRIVVIAADMADQDGINNSYASITSPNGSLRTSMFTQPLQSDDFDTNTVNATWLVDTLKGPLMTCTADIDTTVPGKLYLDMPDSGLPYLDTYCALASAVPLFGDFDINVTFDIINASGTDAALIFFLSETPQPTTATRYLGLSRGDWSGYPPEYDIYVDDGNNSGYLTYADTNLTYREANDTSGKLRITRSGDAFQFYTWNASASQWQEENVTLHEFSLSKALFVSFMFESAAPGWGNRTVTFDDFGVQSASHSVALFSETQSIGVYNITINVTDSLGLSNTTERSNFTIVEVNNPPTVPFILSPVPGASINGSYLVAWSPIFDEENDTLRFNITLLNTDFTDNSTIAAEFGDISTTSYLWDTTAYPDGNYSLMVTVFENATVESYARSYTLDAPFVVNNLPPSVMVNWPNGDLFDVDSVVAISVNSSDRDGVSTTVAQITLPDAYVQNLTLGSDLQSDSFDNDTLGFNWVVENDSLGPGQSCIADIDGSAPDRAHTSLSGQGLPKLDTYCSLVSTTQVNGDFNLTVEFTVNGAFGNDTALTLGLSNTPTSSKATKQVFFTLSNFAGFGQRYEAYAEDGSFAGYVTSRESNDTAGKFRIVRMGDNFTFYTWNASSNAWIEETASQSAFDLQHALFIYLEAESADAQWGSLDVAWDNLTITGDGLLYGMFANTSQIGTYNITFFSNDSFGRANATEQTSFIITQINDPPTTPFLVQPAPANVIGKAYNISWATVFDQEQDSLRFNISLLNSDLSFNQSLAAEYGNATTNTFSWDTTAHVDGAYALEVTVYENETAQAHSKTYTLLYPFTIDNTAPDVAFIAPTPTNGTIQQAAVFEAQANATDPHFASISMEVYNSGGSLVDSINSLVTPLDFVFTLPGDGVYRYNATAVDSVGNKGITETRTIIVDNAPPQIAFVSPLNQSYSQYTILLTINATDNNQVAAVWYTFNGTNTTYTGPVNITGVQGNNTIIAYATDAANNSVQANITFVIDTVSPQWSDPAANQTSVYWNQTIAFNASWQNTDLSGYIFSTNQSGSWANSTFSPFSGPANTSFHEEQITADAGTVVAWYFWANDTAGNSNQTSVQSFTVLDRPTIASWTPAQYTYPHGKKPGAGFDVIIPIEVRYEDQLASNPVPNGMCILTNSQTDEAVNLVYNASTGNYTGAFNDFTVQGFVQFMVNCSAPNHAPSNVSAVIHVEFVLYFTEDANASYGLGPSDSTTHWASKVPPNGDVFNASLLMNASEGSNSLLLFPFFASGDNRSISENRYFYGNYTSSVNISVSDSACRPYICISVLDPFLSETYKTCSDSFVVAANIPTEITYNGTLGFSIQKGEYITMDVGVNCTAPVDGLAVAIHYNYTGQNPNLRIDTFGPFVFTITQRRQMEADYTLGPNSSINSSRLVAFLFNNTQSSADPVIFVYRSAIQSIYPKGIALNSSYVYLQNGSLWASDNATAAAPMTVFVDAANQIHWTTPVIPAYGSVVQDLYFLAVQAVRDEETLIPGAPGAIGWNVTVYPYTTPIITWYNITVFTNASAYFVPATYSYTVFYTNGSGTFDISSNVSINRSSGILTFPMIDSFNAGLSYTVNATDIQQPTIVFTEPTPADGSVNNSTLIINASSTDDTGVDSCVLSWNGANETMNLTGPAENVTCMVSKSGLSDGNYSYVLFARDIAGNWNASAARSVIIDNCIPSLSNTSWSDWEDNICVDDQMEQSRFLIEFDSNDCGEVNNATYFEYRLVGPSLINSTWSDWYNLTACLPDDNVSQERNLTQFDAYACAANTTFFEYQNVTCDYCTPSLTNTSWSAWENTTCSGSQMNQSRFLVEYDNNFCGEVSNQTYFEYQLVGPSLVNTTWSEWMNVSCLINDTMNQSRSLVQYDMYACAVNTTFFEYQVNGSCVFCSANWTNGSFGGWYNVTGCLVGDYYTQERNATQYDLNTCPASVNSTIFEYQNLTCDYCTPSLANTSWSDWQNVSCSGQNMNQSRSLVEYDANSCGEIGNTTYFEYQLVGPAYLNSSWSVWYNITACLTDDNVSQERNLTQFDSYACAANSTFFEYQNVSCDYCTPSLVNTTWSDWANESCSGSQMNQSRSLVEYDVNACGEVLNQTYFEYQLVGPSLVNTTWSEWMNVSCLINDTMNQSRSLVQYDMYACAANTTFFEYQVNGSCVYCTANWTNSTFGSWYDVTDCLVGDYYTQERNATQYDAALCPFSVNSTVYEYQNLTCDYCTPSLMNTSWSAWVNATCEGSQRNQSRSLIEFDANACGEIANTTYFEYQLVGPSFTNSSWGAWYDVGVCLPDDNQMQERNLTQYDAYGCAALTRFFEYRNVTCDACTPSMTNTSWSAWENTTCSGNQMNQSRFLVEYDSNLCGEVSNQTYFEYRLMGPVYLNTTWSEWINASCLINDIINQSRSLVQYDAYACAANTTFLEYQVNGSCVYCTANWTNSSWGDWHNVTVCLPSDIVTQQRNATQYDANACPFSSNSTLFEYQNITCNSGPPSLGNVTALPALPLVTNGSVANVSVGFTPSKLPVNVTFTLYNSTGGIADVYGPAVISDLSDLPIAYPLPLIGDGVYNLTMDVNDMLGNVNSTYLGSITIDTSSPSASNITSTPPLPLLNNGSGQSISVSFDSSEYPVNATFTLRNASGTIVHTFGPSLINNMSGVPLNYPLPAGLPEGVYNLSLSLVDPAGNSNSQDVGTINVTLPDLTAPAFTSTTITPYAVLANANVSLFASATDNKGIQAITATVTLPNGTTVTSPLPANYTPTLVGRYQVTFVAYDTSNNTATRNDFFDVGASNFTLQFNVFNSSVMGIPVNTTVYLTGSNNTVKQESFTGTFADDYVGVLYDLLFQTDFGLGVRLADVNISQDNNRPLGLDKGKLNGFLVTYGVNNSYDFTSATMVLSYANSSYSNEDRLRVMKCDQWDFTGRVCGSGWHAISATQDKIRKTFTFTVTSFSGFSIEEQTTPAPSPPSRSSGGGGSAAAAPRRINLTWTLACAGERSVLRAIDGSDGKPLKSATVQVYVGVYAAQASPVANLTTDASGEAKYPFSEGSYTTVISKTGYNAERRNITIDACPVAQQPICADNETLMQGICVPLLPVVEQPVETVAPPTEIDRKNAARTEVASFWWSLPQIIGLLLLICLLAFFAREFYLMFAGSMDKTWYIAFKRRRKQRLEEQLGRLEKAYTAGVIGAHDYLRKKQVLLKKLRRYHH